MFKKRNIQKKIDISKDIQQIEIPQNQQHPSQQQHLTVPKSILTKKINKYSNKITKQPNQSQLPSSQNQKQQPVIVKYGLINKQQVNSKYHAHQQTTEDPRHPQKHTIINLYVKKKMEQLTKNSQQNKQKQRDINTEQILKMQKKYLQMSQQKLAQYDIAQILKRLQNTAITAIKSQVEGRNTYLKNLLQNEHQKMQYASKKQLKTIKQQKQRMEQEFRNKYNDYGRRGYVEKMKYQSMFHK